MIPVVAGLEGGSLFSPSQEGDFQQRWGQEGGYNHHQDHRGEQGVGDDAQALANGCKDETDLTARHHTQSHCQPVDIPPRKAEN